MTRNNFQRLKKNTKTWLRSVFAICSILYTYHKTLVTKMKPQTYTHTHFCGTIKVHTSHKNKNQLKD